MVEPASIVFEDIQGLVRFAHGRLSETSFLLLEVTDASAARAWLRSAPVTTAALVSPLPATALQLAFTADGLRALEVPDAVIEDFSDEFIYGMCSDESRSRRLGDSGANAPGNWAWGGQAEDHPHLLLMLYALPGRLESWQASVQGTEFERAFRLRQKLPTFSLGAIEPFGFVDGISQPSIDWERKQSTDLHQRDRYANLLAAGEVLLGYPNEYGEYTQRPLIDPQDDPGSGILPAAEEAPGFRDFGCNGSYLVVRQLHQDVPKFWQFVDREAGSNSAERERLAALMVGRQRDGTPLIPPCSESIPGIDDSEDSIAGNRFTFEHDPDGHQCPVSAHIRRSNPRSGDFPPGVSGLISRLIRILGFARKHPREDLVASTRFHRIVRRGRTYGSLLTVEDAVKPGAPEGERGLQFICLVANISRQFEFVQNAWAMSAKFGGVHNQSDPLLGNRQPLEDGSATDRFCIPAKQGPARCLRGLPQFVTVRGGAYFFMPGIRALRYIAGEQSRQHESQS